MSPAERAAWLVATATVTATVMYGFACGSVNRPTGATGAVHVAPVQHGEVLSVGFR